MKSALELPSIFVVCVFIFSLVVPAYEQSQAPTIIWTDMCDTDNANGVPFRQIKGAGYPGEYGIKESLNGKGMFNNTPTSNTWRRDIQYGVCGAEYVAFGKTLAQAITETAYLPDVWLNFVFRVEGFPVATNNSTKPALHLFNFGPSLVLIQATADFTFRIRIHNSVQKG